MGIYYFGYMPSFWIRMHTLGPFTPSQLLGTVAPPSWLTLPSLAWLLRSSADIFTYGALVQWWTMFSIVTADGALWACGVQAGRRACW